MFNALLLEKEDDRTKASVQSIDEARLSDGDVLVSVAYSTLNYKDALAITGKVPVVRTFPMVPGIDFAGVVEESSHAEFKPGDSVVLNGWGAGETHWGGLAQKARVSGDHLIPLPEGLTARQAMAVGTAGYTAMLCAQALERHGVAPGDGDVLVTGANGGVGSFAIAILARRGYRVVASTGRSSEEARLRELGAADVIDRSTLSAPGKPLQKERWAAAVDCVGSHTLANVCASLHYGGAVAACGLAQGMDLPATVAPFILRGVALLGVDSVYVPRERRLRAWASIASEVPVQTIEQVAGEIALGEAVDVANRLLQGEVKGRVIVDVNR
ncbi:MULTISPECIES: MDR family oxidoreductase [unclassified Caballeronia]|uniref:acrylyl-CoA reductase (NADPH) n=1 Tax=unclassified Caballeronia TaxID=2646786 RepID=UPI00285BF7C8|nr:MULTISPECIES: MDR family oxidoreductase [unclassified Caballeronia]MDR5753151.1 oxidoreductase [Caballeronia sp. LZ024]MDR5840890.1 oxidoreductase [Caballeronia sp. LZ031]